MSVQDAVEKAEQVPAAGRAVIDNLQRMDKAFARALPAHIGAERFMRIVLTELKQKPALLGADQDSLFGALMLCAQLGLEPGPLGHAYLTGPFRNNKTGKREVVFIPGYRGLIDLAFRSGRVDAFFAHSVFDGDEFEWSLGTDPKIVHKPGASDRVDPKQITHTYAVGQIKGASLAQTWVMNRPQIEAARARSKASSNGPWVTDWEAMALKTPLRRLAKYMPLSPQFATAVAADGLPIAHVFDDLDDLAEAAARHEEAIEAGATEAPAEAEGEAREGAPAGAAPPADGPAQPPADGQLLPDQAATTKGAKR